MWVSREGMADPDNEMGPEVLLTPRGPRKALSNQEPPMSAILFDSTRPAKARNARRFGAGLLAAASVSASPPAAVASPVAPAAEKRTRRPTGPSPIDSAWWAGFSLGIDAMDANPPAELPAAEREAFKAGLETGQAELLDELRVWEERFEEYASLGC
jgi:hypothetical protein